MAALKPMFVGSHFWFFPEGAAFTSPAPGIVSQAGAWPDEDEPTWGDFVIGVVEMAEADPKLGPAEDILVPAPGSVQMKDRVIPYAIPEIKFTLLETGPMAFQMALNTQRLFGNGQLQFNPNGGGGPGMKGILWAQHYDHENVLQLNWQSYVKLQIDGTLKFAPKTMTKPQFIATLLASDNNTGTIFA